MKSLNWLAAAVLVTLALGTANAHPHAYAAGNDVVSLTETEDTDGIPDIGGVRFAVGEVLVLDPLLGNAVFTIEDAVVAAVGGFYCQDLNADSLCGDDGTVAAVEPGELFCGQIEVNLGVDWFDTSETLVFVDGPLFGSPVFSTCGNLLDGTGSEASPGVTGVVHHS